MDSVVRNKNMETEFNTSLFEKKLQSLKDSQESINALSAWCLENRQHHKKIVQAWLNVLKRVKVEHRLTLFYLANDVIQYSKRKNYEFVESWGTTLQKATTMVREEKVKHRVLRIFKIWEQRGIYGEEFLSDLSGLISVAPAKKSEIEPSEFQPSYLISKINACTRLEEDTDLKLKKIKENEQKVLQLDDPEAVVASLKDRQRVEDVEREVEDGKMLIEVVINALNVEIKARRHLTNLLAQADNFYRTQRGEVKVVSNAYKNFGLRVKNLKKRLDEMLQDPTRWSSPIPSPDVNAPSPSPDSDIELPGQDDNTNQMYGMDTSYTAANFYTPVTDQSSSFTNNGFTSFMGSNISFDIHANLFNDSNPASHVSDTSAVIPSNNLIEVVGNQKISSPSASSQHNSNPINLNNIIKQLLPNTPTQTTLPDLSAPVQHETNPYVAQTPLLPPPMPPFTNQPTYNSNSAVYSEAAYTSMPDAYGGSNSRFQQMPPSYIPPPEMPQPYPISADDYNPEEELETWDNDGAWPEPPDMETPESPPVYEKEAVTEPVEYHDVTNNHTMLTSQEDVDHRVLLPPPHLPDHLSNIKGSDTDHRLGRSGNKDVDHRNLISLTGSPVPENRVTTNLPIPPIPPNLWQTDQDYRMQRTDQDYRTQQNGSSVNFVDLANEPPPPPPLPAISASNSGSNVNKRSPGNLRRPSTIDTNNIAMVAINQDNVESIDMELSDDDNAMHQKHHNSPPIKDNINRFPQNKRPHPGGNNNNPKNFLFNDQFQMPPRKKPYNNTNNIPILVDSTTSSSKQLESPPIPPVAILDEDVDAAASTILETISQDDFLDGLPEIDSGSNDKSTKEQTPGPVRRTWYNDKWNNDTNSFNIPPNEFPHQGGMPLPPPSLLSNFHRNTHQDFHHSRLPLPPGPPSALQFRGGLMGHFPGSVPPQQHFGSGMPPQMDLGMQFNNNRSPFNPRGRGASGNSGGFRGNSWNRGSGNRGNGGGSGMRGNRGGFVPRGSNGFRGGRGRGGFREQW